MDTKQIRIDGDDVSDLLLRPNGCLPFDFVKAVLLPEPISQQDEEGATKCAANRFGMHPLFDTRVLQLVHEYNATSVPEWIRYAWPTTPVANKALQRLSERSPMAIEVVERDVFDENIEMWEGVCVLPEMRFLTWNGTDVKLIMHDEHSRCELSRRFPSLIEGTPKCAVYWAERECAVVLCHVGWRFPHHTDVILGLFVLSVRYGVQVKRIDCKRLEITIADCYPAQLRFTLTQTGSSSFQVGVKRGDCLMMTNDVSLSDAVVSRALSPVNGSVRRGRWSSVCRSLCVVASDVYVTVVTETAEDPIRPLVYRYRLHSKVIGAVQCDDAALIGDGQLMWVSLGIDCMRCYLLIDRRLRRVIRYGWMRPDNDSPGSRLFHTHDNQLYLDSLRVPPLHRIVAFPWCFGDGGIEVELVPDKSSDTRTCSIV